MLLTASIILSLFNTVWCLPHPRAAGAKRGLVYAQVSDTKPFVNTIPSWGYNYASSSGGLSSYFEYVPMVASPNQFSATNINNAIAAGSKYLLGYNEPDTTSGANLSPQAAATNYKNQLTPLSSKIALGAPAVSSSTASGAGLNWLNAFHAACAGSCGITFVPLHWYGSSSQSGAAQAQAFQQYVSNAITQVHSIFGSNIPIWITEFAAQPLTNQQVNADFLNAVLPSLKNNANIARFSFYGDVQGSLVSGSSLTQDGQMYANTA